MPKYIDDLDEVEEELPEDNFDNQIIDPEWDYYGEDNPIWIGDKKLSDLVGKQG